jgi:hypothetical protein
MDTRRPVETPRRASCTLRRRPEATTKAAETRKSALLEKNGFRRVAARSFAIASIRARHDG